ncbi:glycosyltransferase family 2 protein [Ruegeria sp. ANG-S4]|uniref:glycosyltransferase family 2 protein n=1 Tax=Ruegeria sp. ANG-S4 TaxID=1577904 RepID=UPI000689F4C1|nr:glycosyltransferase family 2 protein [Ruegeria sp. ANG-S4]
MLTVGAIVSEPVQILARFIDWYMQAGADRIHLFFDDPLDPAIDAVKDHQGVTCTRCDASFWGGIGANAKDRFTLRQNAAMKFAYQASPKGWFLNVDGDELVHLDGRNLAFELNRQDGDVQKVRFRPVEPIQTPDDDLNFHVRRPGGRPWGMRGLYGELYPGFRKRGGLVGHNIGKVAIRTGLQLSALRQHDAWGEGGVELTEVTLGPDEGAWLLHFVDGGFLNWRKKVEWRLSSRGFTPRIKAHFENAFSASDPEAALKEIYETIYIFDEQRVELLKRSGAHHSWLQSEIGCVSV